MRRAKEVSIALLVFVSASPAWCQDRSEGAAGAARSARFVERASRPATVEGLRFAPAAPVLNAAFGIARDRDEEGAKAVATPFSLSYKTAGDDWLKFQAVGDGYARVYEPGSPSVADLADITLNVSRPLWSPSWTGMAGVALPTGGDVGSSNATQHVRLAYGTDLDGGWGTYGFADLKHYNGDTGGKSRYAKLVYAELSYTVAGQAHGFLLNVSRWWRHGAVVPATTDVGVEYDFTLSPKWGGALSFLRGLTSGARHSAIELDLIYTF